MKVVLVSNYYTHHQAPFSERMEELTGGNYFFIATQVMSEERRNMGWGIDFPNYVLSLDGKYQECQKLIDDAEVVIYSSGNAPYKLLRNRLKEDKLTFVYSERLYRNKSEKKKLLYHFFKYGRMYRPHKNLYLLCAGAYVSGDYASIGCFKNKAFKWGYFTDCKRYADIGELLMRKASKKERLGLKREDVSILWVSRFIGLKHPELAVSLAKRLKSENISFKLYMIGNGILEDEIGKLIVEDALQDVVFMLGAMTPDMVRTHMEESDIFLFTSDRNEGWGAVLNESMNSGCAVVANRQIGSVPFMIKDGVNGFSYDSSKDDDLFEKVVNLINDKLLMTSVGRNAYNTVINSWSPDIAADRFCKLSEHLMRGEKGSPYSDGVCSIAEIIK